MRILILAVFLLAGCTDSTPQEAVVTYHFGPEDDWFEHLEDIHDEIVGVSEEMVLEHEERQAQYREEFEGDGQGGTFGRWAQNLTITPVSASTTPGHCFHEMKPDEITCWRIVANIGNDRNEAFNLDRPDWKLEGNGARWDSAGIDADSVAPNSVATVEFEFDVPVGKSAQKLVFVNFYDNSDTKSGVIAQ